mmetsp:Transcript_45856/g.109196  ORF Transcript_45856/g.109196 Transcript_45856/m.109196 type:complete len:182 (-) Transcript_45856:44-589(-)
MKQWRLLCLLAIGQCCPAAAVLTPPKAVDDAKQALEAREVAFFGNCLGAVQNLSKALTQEPKVSAMQACSNSSLQMSSQLGIECSELVGRVSEALEQGYLAKGEFLCAGLVREDARHQGASLTKYAPLKDAALLTTFCDAVKADEDVSSVCDTRRMADAASQKAHPSAALGNLVALLRRPA